MRFLIQREVYIEQKRGISRVQEIKVDLPRHYYTFHRLQSCIAGNVTGFSQNLQAIEPNGNGYKNQPLITRIARIQRLK